MPRPSESISVFDIFKIGVGPSSSHTMGPWRAAQQFLKVCRDKGVLDRVERIRVDLFGSLAKTGKGHGTDVAVVLALSGEDPVTCATDGLVDRFAAIREAQWLKLDGAKGITFIYDGDIIFHLTESLPFHPNGIRFTAFLASSDPNVSSRPTPGHVRALPDEVTETYYSVGGGFVVQEDEQRASSRGAGEKSDARPVRLPFPIDHAHELTTYCEREKKTIPQIVLENEKTWRSESDVRAGLLRIWRVMQECIYRGCHTGGILPGGLNVVRRASTINRKLISGVGFSGHKEYDDLDGWLDVVRHSTREFQQILKWVSTFALAVNEENAAFGRVVTAPTNGAAGVIPSVMMYYWCFCRSSEQGIIDFMLTAGELGSLFKKGATISAAMGGCQAEIGVSSAMAAGGLCQCLGGSVGQVQMAAEIAMEHHLGMTCDPVGGLVQIPCIERNTMGAIKAITAANIALEGDPSTARVTLDEVIKTMWQTSLDMQSKYKETAEGGLAVHVSVGVAEC